MISQEITPSLITQKEDNIILENDAVRVTINPKNGGKLRSFFSKRTNTEFFYQDTNKISNHGNYISHDISGFDECFPTVATCEFSSGKRKGVSLGDHGYLWQGAWKTQIKDEVVLMSKDLPLLECVFERTCRLAERGQLRLDYKIRNYGTEPLPYVYSAHPMLRATKHTQLILPEEVNKVYIYLATEDFGFCNNTWVDYPFKDNSIMQGPFLGVKSSFVKFFAMCSPASRAMLYQKETGETLQIQFDTNLLTYLGVFIQIGYYDGNKIVLPFLGLEPTTGIGDELATCNATGTVQEIKPGQEVRFWTTLTLENSKKKVHIEPVMPREQFRRSKSTRECILE